MPIRAYRVLNWADPVGDGISQSRYVGLNGVAKGPLPDQPRIVANELVCSLLARAILLPTPPGFLVDRSGEPWFVSLDFTIAGEKLPPVNPSRVLADHPRLACGILMFDVWVLNSDRHAKNLAHDTTTGAVAVFDHSLALLPRTVPADEFFSAREGVHGLVRHCLADHIRDGSFFREWQERIEALPDFYVHDALQSATSCGYSVEEANLIERFLLERRGALSELSAALCPNLEPMLELDVADEPATPEVVDGDGAGISEGTRHTGETPTEQPPAGEQEAAASPEGEVRE